MKNDEFDAATVERCAICTCPADWQGMDHTSGCKSRASRDLAVTQDCAPAGTVSKADICATLCKAHGTAQCAAICMSHSSLHTTDGCCPEAKRVWVHKARALLSQFDVRRK